MSEDDVSKLNPPLAGESRKPGRIRRTAAVAETDKDPFMDRRRTAAPPGHTRTKADVGSYLPDRRLSETVARDVLGEGEGPNPLFKSVGEARSRGKVIVGGTPRTEREYQARHVEASASFSTAIAQFGISPEFDNYDTLDMIALHLIELLQSNIYSYAHLTKYERNILYRYFHKTNPVIGRVMDLHTDLPLSKVRLQAPADVPEIVRDYVMNFYEGLFKRLNVDELLRDMVLSYLIYGEAYVQVDDFYQQNADRILQDLHAIDEKIYRHEPDDLAFLQKVELQYKADPTKVSLSDRIGYLEKKFKNFFDSEYRGPSKLTVLQFYNILEYLENPDIGFEAIRYGVSDPLKRLRDMGYTSAQLVELGYSEGFVELLQLTDTQDSYTIDNDTYSGLPFIFTMRRTDSQSLILRVLTQAIEWDAAQRSIKAKIQNLGRLGRVVSAEDISLEQAEALKIEVTRMLEDPNHAIVTNYKVEWEEVNAFIKQELNEMIARLADIKVDIAMGMGIPDTLLSGDSAYTGDNIKIDLLNTYYLSFNQRLQNVIEERLIRPIALRKGFVTIDDWGNPTLVYPKLTFTRIGLRDASVMEILFSLYQKNSIPVSVLYEIFNLDPDDIKRGVEKDLFTVNDPNFNTVVQELYAQAASDIYQESTVKEKIMGALQTQRRFGDQLSTSPQEQQMPGAGGSGNGATPPSGTGMPGGAPGQSKSNSNGGPVTPLPTPKPQPPQL